MEEKIYKCICGKEFTKPNSFNAHKSNCSEHLKSKGVDVSEVYKKRGESVSKTLKSKSDAKKQQALDTWIAEKHVCEKCGKIMTTLYGSGRFCSRHCSNSRNVTDTWRTNTSNALTGNNLTVDEFVNSKSFTDGVSCDICGKLFKNNTALRTHLSYCKKKHNIPKYAKVDGIELDIEQEQLELYISQHPTCEICGKTVDEAVRYNGKYAPKRLSVDHDHKTNKFRGVLCQLCNRQLGWFEKYEEEVYSYLKKME